MSRRDIEFDMQQKLLMIGDSGVGKSSLLLRYINDKFSPTFITSIGIDFKIKNIQLDGKRIKLQIWDTAGQERFRTITTSYFRGSQGILLVCDCTDLNSFKNIETWLSMVQANCNASVNLFIGANKSDITSARAIPDSRELAAFFQFCGVSYYVSAKDGLNVENVFLSLASIVKNRLSSPNSNSRGMYKVLEPELYIGDINLLGIGLMNAEYNDGPLMFEVQLKYSTGFRNWSELKNCNARIIPVSVKDVKYLVVSVRLVSPITTPWTQHRTFDISKSERNSRALYEVGCGDADNNIRLAKSKKVQFLINYRTFRSHRDWQSHWVADNECAECQNCMSRFSVSLRRHHCRKCGKCICKDCSPKDMTMYVESYSAVVRVCKQCKQQRNIEETVKSARSFPDSPDFAVEGYRYLTAFPGLTLDDVVKIPESEAVDLENHGSVLKNTAAQLMEMNSFAEGATSFVFSGKYNGIPVAVKQFKVGYLEMTRRQSALNTDGSFSEKKDPLFTELSILRVAAQCPYIIKMIVSSIAFDIKHPFIATEMFEEFGTLNDVLNNHSIALPWTWRLLAVFQIASAVKFLDSKSFAHVDIKAENCVVASLSLRSQTILTNTLTLQDVEKFDCVVKLFDFNSSDVYGTKAFEDLYGNFRTSTHAPPETLVKVKTHIELNGTYDVFSLGILMAEVASRGLLYEDTDKLMASIEALENAIILGRRPLISVINTSDSDRMPDAYPELAAMCWESDPKLRPPVNHVVEELKRMFIHAWKSRPEPPAAATNASLSDSDQGSSYVASDTVDDTTDDTTSNRDLAQSSEFDSPLTSQKSSFPRFIVFLRKKDFKKPIFALLNKNKSVAEKFESKIKGLKALLEEDVDKCDYICSSATGTFQLNVIYQKHPDPSRPYYIPLQEFAEKMLEEKEQEFLGIMQALGAKEIQLDQQEANSSAVGGKVVIGAHGADLGVEGHKAQSHFVHRGCARNFGSRPLNVRPFFDNARRYVFYQHEPSWQGIKEARVSPASTLHTTKVSFTFNSANFVSAQVVAKVQGLGGIDLGGMKESSITFTQQYTVDFFTELSYREANEEHMKNAWHPGIVQLFLVHLQLHEYREAFAAANITGRDLLLFLSTSELLRERVTMSKIHEQRLLCAIEDQVMGRSTFEV